MLAAGYAGRSVASGFYKGSRCHVQRPIFDGVAQLFNSILNDLERQALGLDASAVADILDVSGGPALFVTANFSHALHPSDRYLYHKDARDCSVTALILFQDENTPNEHSAKWWDSDMHEPTMFRGGLVRVFNGCELHGAIPPETWNPDYPWFGAALLIKDKDLHAV